MSSKVTVNGNTFEEKKGKLYINGSEVSANGSLTQSYPWTHLVLSFFIGFAISGMLAKAFGA